MKNLSKKVVAVLLVGSVLTGCMTTNPTKPTKPQITSAVRIHYDRLLTYFLDKHNLTVKRLPNESLDDYNDRRLGVVAKAGLGDELIAESKEFTVEKAARVSQPQPITQSKPTVKQTISKVSNPKTTTTAQQETVETVETELEPIIINKAGSAIDSVEDDDLLLKTSSSISVDIK